MKIPGICGPNRYSILEFNGFNEVQNSAHELGHILGAAHDGTVYNNINASSCPMSANNIMTPAIGAFYNAQAMYYFSNCSINAFKNTLLSPNRKYIFKEKE